MNLDPSILERLMIDRALGEMSADVRALLEAVLAQDPQGRALQAEHERTVARAREAMERQVDFVPVELPPLPAVSRSLGRRWRFVGAGASLAACLLIGAIVGRAVPRGPAGTAPASPPMPVAARAPDAPAESESQLWSVRGLLASAGSPREAPRRNIVWQSPVRKPTVEIEP